MSRLEKTTLAPPHRTDLAALAWLLRECREHPVLPRALAEVSWLAEALAGWMEWDDRGNPCDPIWKSRALNIITEVMRRTSVDAQEECPR